MIATKLHIPEIGATLVSRPVLIDKLNKGLNQKLTLVSAPAGYGKTTLVSQWIHQSTMPAVWYSMDKRDNDPVIFLTYLLRGIQEIKKDFGSGVSHLLNAPQRPDVESIVSLLISEVQDMGKDFILVLDDFHLVNSRDVMDIISNILGYLPTNMHLVISTRSDPSIPLARLRSQNMLLELRSAELSFTDQNTAVFLNKRLRLGLSGKQVNTLRLKTEGWIAGLQLTALSIQSSKDVPGFIKEFAGDNRYIMDYLLEEVLHAQADEISDFLLRTSMLEQFSGNLCDYLLDRSDSTLVLESLEKNNMFLVALDPVKKWYRYHHLFADLLKQRLIIRHKGEISKLHQKASLWFEENHMMDLAIDHAIEMEDYKRASTLLDTVIESLWQDGHHDSILKYGASIPDKFIACNPLLCLYYGWVLISGGKFREASQYLNASEKVPGIGETLRGKFAVARAFQHSSSGNVKGIFESCPVALSTVTEEDPVWYSWAWYSCGLGHMMTGNLMESNKAFSRALEVARKTANLYLISTIVIRYAFCELQRGKFRSAYSLCTELLDMVQAGGYSPMAENEWSFAGLYSTLGFIQHEWGDLDQALHHSKLGFNLSGRGPDYTSRVFNGIVYVRSLRSSGDIKKAEEIISELDKVQSEHELFPYLQYTFLALKLGTSVRFGLLKQAKQFALTLKLDPSDEVDGDNELLYTSFACLLLEEGRTDEAGVLLTKLHDLATSERRIERLVELNILNSLLHILLENQEEASTRLAEAISLAEEENMVMHFIQHGIHLSGTLNELYRDYSSGMYSFSRKFLQQLIRNIEKSNKRKQDSMLYSLSKREMEVLGYMAEDLSNQEIANLMFVSLNTVKAHAKNIHLKLEVDSRTKAVAKAKETGIL